MTDSATLADRIGITYRQLDHWARKGWLRADNPNPGHGHPRRFSATEARVAEHMATLVSYGLTVEAAHFLARCTDGAADRVINTIREAREHNREVA